MAGVDLVNAAGGHAVAAAVEGLHCRRGETAPAHLGGPVHGRQGPLPPLRPGEVLPQRPAPLPAGQLQGRNRGGEAARPFVRYLLHAGQQGPDPPGHKGGAQRGSGEVRRRPADVEPLGGLGQGGVEVLQLHVEQVHARRGQLDALFPQPVPVLPAQKARAGLDGGQHVVVAPHEEQVLHPLPVVAGDLGCLDLVQGHGDGAHVVLGQHQLQEPGKLLPVQLRVLQDGGELVHNAAQQLPELAVLPGPLELSQLLQPPGALLQLPGQLQLLQKRPQGLQLSPGPLLFPQTRRQTAQRAPHPAAQGVDLDQLLGLPGGKALPPARRIAGPVAVPDPHGPVDVPGHHVVLQHIALAVRQPRQPGLQPAEHVLVLVPAGHRVQGPGQQAQHRLLQHVAAAAEVHRHAVALKDILNGGLVLVQVPGRHADVPEAAGPGPDQLQYPGRHVLRLREHALRPAQLHAPAVPLVPAEGTEKAGRQVLQGGLRLPGGQHLHCPGGAAVLRQTDQPVPGPDALLEDLQTAAVPQQGDGDGPGRAQQDLDELHLLGGKVCKAIQVYILSGGAL